MGKGLAITSMTLGILSILLCAFGPVPMFMGVLAIVFCAAHDKGKGMAIAGLVTGIIGTLLSLIFTLALLR